MTRGKLITVDLIHDKAEKRYAHVLRTWLEGSSFEPWGGTFRVYPPTYEDVKPWREALEINCHSRRGFGYLLEWRDRRLRQFTRVLRLPISYSVNTLEDYLALVEKEEQFLHFQEDVRTIRERLPQLEDWMRANPEKVIEEHGVWPKLLRVCEYFIQNPKPGCFIRQLPIDVDTKFVQRHLPTLRDLLDFLLPSEAVEQSNNRFEARFGLRYEEPFVYLRLLGNQFVSYGVDVQDLLVPRSQCAGLPFRPRYTLVVENKDTFWALPFLPDCIGIWGEGFAVRDIVDCLSWRQTTQILYWGDLDGHGFEILASLRSGYPNTKSVMMDRKTLDFHREFLGEGTRMDSVELPLLSHDEQRLLETLVSNNQRLEQEHIGFLYYNSVLCDLIGVS